MKEFRIEFDSPTSAFYAGQIVSGRVILNLTDKPKKVRGKFKRSWYSCDSHTGSAYCRS